MPCTFTEYPGVGTAVTKAEPVPGAGFNIGGPYLVVSNQLEKLEAGSENIQLYKCVIPFAGATTQRFRVFIWHESSGSNKNFYLRARLTAGTGAVTNFEGYSETSADAGNLGKCCAKSLLFNTYPTNFADKALSTSEILLYSKVIEDGRTLGGHASIRSHSLAGGNAAATHAHGNSAKGERPDLRSN